MAADEELEADERRRLARCIWGYSNSDQPALAKAAGLHPDRLRAILGKRDAPTLDELGKLAKAANVPRSIALNGFQRDKLEALEHRLGTLRAELRREVQRRKNDQAELAGHIRQLELRLEESTKTDRRRRGPGANG